MSLPLALFLGGLIGALIGPTIGTLGFIIVGALLSRSGSPSISTLMNIWLVGVAVFGAFGWVAGMVLTAFLFRFVRKTGATPQNKRLSFLGGGFLGFLAPIGMTVGVVIYSLIKGQSITLQNFHIPLSTILLYAGVGGATGVLCGFLIYRMLLLSWSIKRSGILVGLGFLALGLSLWYRLPWIQGSLVKRSILSHLHSGSSRIDMRFATGFPWTRLYIFPPYTLKPAVQERVGRRVSAWTTVYSHDGGTLLVFMNGETPKAALEFTRNEADFSHLSRPDGYPSSEAVFVRNDASSSLELAPYSQRDY